MMLKDKAIVFQIKDESGEWCDMDEDEQIQNKSEINVLIIPFLTVETTSTFFDPSQLKAGEKVDLDLSIYTESSTRVLEMHTNGLAFTNHLPSTSSKLQTDLTPNNNMDDSTDKEDDRNVCILNYLFKRYFC